MIVTTAAVKHARMYVQLTETSYEEGLDPPGRVVVEAKPSGVWLGIKDLPAP